MVPRRGTNTGPSRGPNTCSAAGPIVTQQGNQHWPLLRAHQRSAGGPIVHSRGTNTGPSHWPLLWAQHLASRRSNSTQQGNQHWPLSLAPLGGPTPGQQEVQW
jgi:hypothetical protein